MEEELLKKEYLTKKDFEREMIKFKKDFMEHSHDGTNSLKVNKQNLGYGTNSIAFVYILDYDPTSGLYGQADTGGTFSLPFLNAKELTVIGFVANNAQGVTGSPSNPTFPAPATINKRYSVSGKALFGKSIRLGSQKSGSSLTTPIASGIIQGSTTFFFDGASVANTRVTSTTNTLVDANDSGGVNNAALSVFSYNSTSITLDAFIKANHYMFLTFFIT